MLKVAMTGAALFACLSVATAAHAKDIIVGPFSLGSAGKPHPVSCFVLNIGSSPIDITSIRLSDPATGGGTGSEGSCNAVEPGRGCGASAVTNFDQVACKIVTKANPKKVRAVISGPDVTTGFPAATIEAK